MSGGSIPSSFCADNLAPGGCTRQDCRLRHDVFRCDCGRAVACANRDEHVAGRRHRDAIQARNQKDRTRGKSVRFDLSSQLANSTESRVSSSQNNGSRAGVFKHCPTCDTDVSSQHWAKHLGSSQHRRLQRLADTDAEFDHAKLDKNGIVVSHKEGIHFGIVEMVDDHGTAKPISLDVTIRKTEDYGAIFLAEYHLSSTKHAMQKSSYSAELQGKSKFINTSQPRTIVVTFRPSYEGQFTDTLELFFHASERKERFSIIRHISANVGSSGDHELLKPTAPYVKKKISVSLLGIIMPSLRPSSWTKTIWRVYLPMFDAPPVLIRHAFDRRENRKLVKNNHLPAVFNERSHGKHFRVLMHIEEEERRRDLHQYSMYDVNMEQSTPNYTLEVPGLAESRPTVLVGDYVLVMHHNSNDDKWYEGRVQAVTETAVKLRFSDGFSLYQGKQMDVRFVLNRLPFRRMYQALALPFCPARVLFPDIEHVLNTGTIFPENPNDIVPVNHDIAGNPEQLEIVKSILQQPQGSPPFIIFGPPGTGKTVTVVEAIHQLLLRDPEPHILACAPSNSAADLIAMKLMGLGNMDGLFRLNSTSREYRKLPKVLREFSRINGNMVFAIPLLEELRKFRVVVSTCVSGGVPYSLGIEAGYFSHIFVDEAGQATEPELMIPIKTMLTPSTNIVLAGDIQQLGPTVRSGLARKLGLDVSYLMRVMSREVYNLDVWKGQTIVKLVKNFRSHPDILAFSNAQFYSGDLKACGDPVLTHSLTKSTTLVKKNYPVVFHGISGKDEREKSSPSFFNIDEASLVKKYCNALIYSRSSQLRPEDIGVITPYHAQARKILQILSHSDIQVGSVEEFQGQERRVIILSTVRSNANFLRHDIKHALGFVANPRRLNVALTRAQALLIVIGDPMVLSLDPVWCAFLREVHGNGGWRGKEMEFPEMPFGDNTERYGKELRAKDEGVMEETIQRLRSMVLTDVDLGDVGTDSDDM